MANATAVIWWMLLIAETGFCRLHAPGLLREVRLGVRYVNGVRVKEISKQKEAAA